MRQKTAIGRSLGVVFMFPAKHNNKKKKKKKKKENYRRHLAQSSESEVSDFTAALSPQTTILHTRTS